MSMQIRLAKRRLISRDLEEIYTIPTSSNPKTETPNGTESMTIKVGMRCFGPSDAQFISSTVLSLCGRLLLSSPCPPLNRLAGTFTFIDREALHQSRDQMCTVTCKNKALGARET